MKKIMSLILVLVMFLSCFGIAFADEGTSTIVTKSDVYEKIKDDYMYITGTTAAEADELFLIIETTGITQEIREYVGAIIPENLKTSEDIVLYIQNDYMEIVSNLTTSEKEMIDLFFLEYGIMYYRGNYEAYCDLKEIYEFKKELATLKMQRNSQTRSVNDTICTLTIYSDTGAGTDGNSGHGDGSALGKHSFLRFENLSSQPIMVAGLEVDAGESVTVGTFAGSSTYNGTGYRGTWFNREYARRASYFNTYSKGVNISSDDLYIASQLLMAYDWWSLTENCAFYASTVWNQFGVELSAGVIPSPKALANSIIATGRYNYNQSYTAGDTVYVDATTPREI